MTSIPGERIEIREPPTLVLTSKLFVEGFVPPDYLVDGILQTRFCYSLTGATGAGKTAVSLFIAASVALGQDVGGNQAQKGRVLYLAGENPDDIRMRWIAMSVSMQFDVDTIEVYFIPGVFKISELEPAIRREIERIGDVVLVVVDTSAAFYEGAEENANVEMGRHARLLRRLTSMPGRPTVLVNCHPTKNASLENLQPRGGGAFIAEMDGNLTCAKQDLLTELHWQGKFRGPDFEPIYFELVSTRTDRLVDSQGRQIPTVVAKPISETDREKFDARAQSMADTLLICMHEAGPGASIAKLAEAADWRLSTGGPNKSKVERQLKSLEKEKLVKKERGAWVLTEKGTKLAEKLEERDEVF
jgi:hypothetical protein